MAIRIRKLKQPEPALLELPPDDGNPADPGATGTASSDAIPEDTASANCVRAAGASGPAGLPGALSDEDFDDDDVIDWQVACEDAAAEGRPLPPRPAPKAQPKPSPEIEETLGDGWVLNVAGNRYFRLANYDKWAIQGVGHPASPAQVEIRIFEEGRVTIKLALDGRLSLEPGATVTSTLGNTQHTLVEPTIEAALKRLRQNEPPELEAARTHRRDIFEITNEKVDLDLEEQELRARHRRLVAPGRLRGHAHEVAAIDRRLVEISERLETLRLERNEISRQSDIVQSALKERIGPVLQQEAEQVEWLVRGDLVHAQETIVRTLAPILRGVVKAHAVWRAAAGWRNAASNKANVEMVLRRLLEEDNAEEQAVEDAESEVTEAKGA